MGEAIAKALEHVVPERSCPQVYKMGMPTVIFGTNPRDGQMFIDHSVDTFAAYCGAVKGQDGWGGMNVSFGNLIRATAEINESIFPVRQLWRDYETDTRRRRASSAATAAASTESRCSCPRRSTPTSSASGIRCQASPAAARARRTGCIVRVGGDHTYEVGDTRRLHRARGRRVRTSTTTAAAAGWGDPLARPPERVLDDVLDEYVSVEAARRDYGVVLTARSRT